MLLRKALLLFSLVFTLSFAYPVYAASNLTAGAPLPAMQTIPRGSNTIIAANGVSGGVPPYSYTWYEKTPNLSKFVIATDCRAPKSMVCIFTALPTINVGTYTFVLQVIDNSAPISEVSNSSPAYVYVINPATSQSTTTTQVLTSPNLTASNQTVSNSSNVSVVPLSNVTVQMEEQSQQEDSALGLIVVLIIIVLVYFYYRRSGTKARK